MGKKKQFKGQSKLKGRDAATGINVRKERERIAHFEKTGEWIIGTVEKCEITFEPTGDKVDPNSMGEYYHAKAAEPGALVIRPFELSAEDLTPTPVTEFGEVKDPIIVGVDPGTGNLGYIKLSDIKNVAMKPGTPEYERNTASRPNPVIEDRHRVLHGKVREFFKANPVHVVRPTPVQYDSDEIHFDRAKPVIAPKLTTNYVSDKVQHVPVIRGISTFLTPAEVESLHKGEFVASGDFTRGLDLSKQDPFFFAVVGAPAGTIIANSKGSVLLPNVKIPLGSKFDYRL